MYKLHKRQKNNIKEIFIMKTLKIKLEKDIYQYLQDYIDDQLERETQTVEEFIKDLCNGFVYDHSNMNQLVGLILELC